MVVEHPLPRSQRGFSLLGLLLVSIVVGSVALVVLKVFPTVNEYLTIQRSVEKLASMSLSTVADIRKKFDQQKDIEYAIVSISGKDLDITKENDVIVISYAYDKEIELVKPVYLLIKYEGSSKR
ncbi:MAG: DUF4845 domain-containing protein [Burkholderiaceae bacterium]|nr:DUF4845 domain-containing protein [Burkholderiaceae bacterium]